MTVQILLLLMLLPLAISCDETEILPTIDNYRLSKISNYSSTSASLPYGFVTFEYDERGNITKESMFDYPGTLFTYTLYEYSNNNLRRKQTFDGMVGHLALGGYVDYFYDNGNLTREEWYLADGTLVYTLHNDYEGNNLKETYKKNDALGVHHLFKYTYDDKNRLDSESVFMYDKVLENFFRYFYDEEDRLMRTEHFNQDSVMISRIEKVYHGSDELPDEELSFSADGELRQRLLIEYDSWGNAIGCTADGNATCSAFKKRYNGKLLLEEIRYHPGFACAEWAVTRYEYEVR